ncbi:MAG: hypothetical protein MUF06_19675 [Pirellulaceae bacterium]|jgi:hypothetical protein|nr:hypothetical protein [Pirellulaceae bacterium]
MSDEFDTDAGWQSQDQSLEARLAAAVPRPSRDEQQAILYAAAFAAGRSSAARRTRRWQGAAALLATIALLGWVPWLSLSTTPAGRSQPPEVVKTAPLTRNVELAPAENEIALEQRSSGDATGRQLRLDAWQVPEAASESLARELAQYRSLEPNQQELSVGALSRRLNL